MDSALLSALIGFVTAVLGSLLSHRLLVRRSHREFAERYRNRLFDKQLAAYEALWKTLRRASIYFNDDTVFVYENGQVLFSRPNAVQLAVELTDVFFTEHGLYLSKTTRKALFNARDRLKFAAARHELDEPKVRMAKEESGELGTALRLRVEATRRDVGLRALRFNPEEIGIPDEQLES